MSVDHRPLFRPDALARRLKDFEPGPLARAARPKLAKWADLFATDAGLKQKETGLLGDFVRDVFGDLLGYAPPPAHPYSLRTQATVKVDNKFADAALGRFGGPEERFAIVVEGKGPRDPLDRPFAGRHRSAVEQSLQYAVQLRIDWYVATNMREIRLFHKAHDTRTFERFDIARLATDDGEFSRFVYLMAAERVLGAGGNHLDALLGESAALGRALTNEFYADYRDLRRAMFADLRAVHADLDPVRLLAAVQKILDRVLFAAFCENRELLPRDIIKRAYAQTNAFDPRPVWDNFKGLFQSIDRGNPALKVDRFNGGLFAPDPFIDALKVPDSVCEGFKKLAEYEYGNDPNAAAGMVDVQILGHVFEQSISDLEELGDELAGRVPEANAKARAKTSRKETGAFYTPEFVTRYVVREALGPVLRERFERLRAEQFSRIPTGLRGSEARVVMQNPAAYDVATLTPAQKKALAEFWQAWLTELEGIRVVDPSCGSGAFLIEAFDQLFDEYAKGRAVLGELNELTLFDFNRTILENNLFGVDLNGAAVEIARLSCWIKTAAPGKVLTSLDANIRAGNSVVSDANYHANALDWRQAFPKVFAEGGFDVVVGNPPYVRQEWIKEIKPHLQGRFRAYDGAADLYVYFYELGLEILRPGGRLGFIVTNKWMKAGYGENLRALLGSASWVERVVDFGHAKQFFPDADVFPCILTARKPDGGAAPSAARVCAIPREQLRIDDLSRQIEESGVTVPLSRFGREPWNLEPPEVETLMAKMRENGVPLRNFVGLVPLFGIKTGFNEAYLIDTPTRDKLVADDPSSEPLFRRYLRGQDIDRWRPEWVGLWMIAMKSSANADWLWKGKPEVEAESVFRATHPTLFSHFDGFRAQLVARQDQGEYWWELRSCAYWDKFDQPKIMYQDITWNQRFCLDVAGTLSNNTAYFLPTEDLWAAAALNAPVSWWFAWRTAQHGKDEALRLFTDYLNDFPIPRPTPESRAAVEADVRRLIDIARLSQEGRGDLMAWLRSEFAVEKPSMKLQDPAGLTAADFVAEVKKGRPKKLGLSVIDLKRLNAEHLASVGPLQVLAREAEGLERRVSDAVNAAFGLTPEEVRLIWATAPPRMPIRPPA